MLPTIAEQILRKNLYKLTDKDLDLIKQLCLPYKVISQNVGVDVGVVKKRVARLAIKLKVENRAAVVAKALKLDLVSVNELIYREFDSGKNTFRESN